MDPIQTELVDVKGIEPSAFAVQVRRSPDELHALIRVAAYASVYPLVVQP